MKITLPKYFAVFFCIIVFSAAAKAEDTPGPGLYHGRIFVNHINRAYQDGSEQWPYSTIQSAVDKAERDNVIIIAEGTYSENLILPDNWGLSIKGGYKNGNFDIRDIAFHKTIISGNNDKAVINIDYTGGYGDYQVYEIDGLVIENGQRGISARNWGNGGIAVLKVSNNIIQNNGGLQGYTDFGGGINSASMRAEIKGNIIRNNSCGKAGGVFVGENSLDPFIIEDNLVEDNFIYSDHGAGVIVQATNGNIRHNIFKGNKVLESYGWGGGLIVDGNQFSGFNDDIFIELYHNTYTGNEVPSGGSGLFIDEGANVRASNELVYGNITTGNYLNAPIYVDGARGALDAKTILQNCTITDNTGGQYSYGHAVASTGDAEVIIINSIIWNNHCLDQFTDDFYIDTISCLSISFSIYETDYEGDGTFTESDCLQSNPLFAGPALQNYYLMSKAGRWDPSTQVWVLDDIHSPGIDAGDPASLYHNEPEPNGSRINLGRYGNTQYASKSLQGTSGQQYFVGPEREYKSLQEVAGLLGPGDIVFVDGDNIYSGGIVFNQPGTFEEKIYIKGIRVNANRPIISGGVNAVAFTTPYPYNVDEGGHHYVFEGFEIADASFRGIYHQARDLTVSDCLIRDCMNGIMGADQGSGSLLLEYTEITRCGDGGSRHQVYMATDQVNNPGSIFKMWHCYVHNGNGGNNIKSRAERNEIYYNWIEGGYYHELELIGADWDACGGDAHLAREDSDVAGNVIIKKQTEAGNNPDFYVIRIGGDGTGESHGRYRFMNNTIICGTGAVFRIFDSIESLEVHNNVLYNPSGPVTFKRTLEAQWVSGTESISGRNNWVKTGTLEVPSGISGTVICDSPGFVSLIDDNLYPSASSSLLDTGKLPTESPPGLEFQGPLEIPLKVPSAGTDTALNRVLIRDIDIGAYEYIADHGQTVSAVISIEDPSVHGIWLWNYNHGENSVSSWNRLLMHQMANKIIAGDITGDGNLEVIAMISGMGLYYYTFTNQGWNYIAGPAFDISTAKINDTMETRVIASFQEGLFYYDLTLDIWHRIKNIPAEIVISADIDNNGIDELVLVFKDISGLYIYSFVTGSFKRIIQISPSQILCADITGDGKKELVTSFPGHGMYLLRKGDTGWDISRLTYGLPDIDHNISSADLVSDSGSEIIFTHGGRTYFYTYSLNKWQTLAIAPFKRAISARFTGHYKDDLILCEKNSKSIYLYNSVIGIWHLLVHQGDSNAMIPLDQSL